MRDVRRPLAVVLLALASTLAACSAAASPSVSGQPAQSVGPGASGSPAPPASESSEAPASVPADVTTVTIRDLSFGAPEISVEVGAVISFVNADDVEHTVTEGADGAAAPNGRFDEFIGEGESVDVTFADPGDYRITCQFHPEMSLVVHAG